MLVLAKSFSLPYSEVAEVLAMWKGLEFAKDMSFLNLIVESDASNVVLALLITLKLARKVRKF